MSDVEILIRTFGVLTILCAIFALTISLWFLPGAIFFLIITMFYLFI